MKRALAVALAIMMTLPPLLASGQTSGGELVLRVAMQDDIKGLNPLAVHDYWSNLVLQWIYESPILVDYDSQGLMPYIAVGSANLSGKAASWDDCTIGKFGYSPKAGWENESKPEAMIFYDFTNVKWHGGEQMDVRDLMFSYHVAARFQSSDMRCLMDDRASTGYTYSPDKDLDTMHIEVIWQEGDRAALKFQLQTPYADFFTRTLSPLLLPYDIWGSTTSGQAVNETKIWCDEGYNGSAPDSWQMYIAGTYENNPPLGSGLFKLANWDWGHGPMLETCRGHFYSEDFAYKSYIEANFPGQNVKQPTIDGITFRIYKTTEAAMLALENGDIDYISWSVSPWFLPRLGGMASTFCFSSSEPTYFSSSALRTDNTEYVSSTDGFFYIGYNMRKTSFGYKDGNVSRGDAGKPLRKAIACCVDRNRIVMRLLLNHGAGGTGPVSPISNMYNSSVQKYPFDPEMAKSILANAGYKVKAGDVFLTGQAAIDAAGDPNWWYNPDETPIGSSSGGAINLLTPDANYDPVRAQAGLMITQQLRAIGIYATSMPDYSWWSLSITHRDFDMYIAGWNDIGDPAEYMYRLFHSDNAVTGQNYVGYRNESFDSLIDLARSSDNFTVRKKAILDAQATICADLPADVMYWRYRLLAYTGERFFGWIQHGREIFHRDSIINLRGPYRYNLYAMFDSPQLAVFSNSTTQFTVAFKYDDAGPVGNVSVKLDSTIGALVDGEGTTSAGGRFTTSFTAPYVPPTPDNIANGSLAFIQIKSATCQAADYAPAPPRFILVTVYPEEAGFISVSMRADPDIIEDVAADRLTPGFTCVDVEVRDQAGLLCPNATVNLTCRGGMLHIEPRSAPANQEGPEFRITASPQFLANDSSVMEFVLVAEVWTDQEATINTATGYLPLFVQDVKPVETVAPVDTEYPLAEAVLAVAAICAVAIAYGAIRWRKR